MRTITRVLPLFMVLILSAGIVFAVEKQGTQNVPKGKASILIEPVFTIDPARTAVLIMDYQNDIVGAVPENTRTALLKRAGTLLTEARKANIKIIYVVVRFRDDYPEVDLHNNLFRSLKESGRLLEGTPGAEIAPGVAPQPGDIVITKRRISAFPGTDLETLLRSNNISKLVLFGISTSGVVLSTVRSAADLDYSLAVVSDLCYDGDAEAHRVLLDKVFPWQATIVTSGEFLKAIAK